MRGKEKSLKNHQAPNHPKSTIEMIANTEPGAPMYEKFKQRIRLHPAKPSPTIVSGGIRPQFAYGHPTQPRGLSIRERARLMSFPDWYEFLGGLTQGRVQTGDAVPPLLAQAVAEEIANCINGKTVGNDLGSVHVKAISQ
jgi:DNA (cytosine-5)-methyltransferase 1